MNLDLILGLSLAPACFLILQAHHSILHVNSIVTVFVRSYRDSYSCFATIILGNLKLNRHIKLTHHRKDQEHAIPFRLRIKFHYLVVLITD